MNNSLKHILAIFIIAFTFGCNRQRELTKPRSIRSAKLIEELQNSQLQYEWFNTKISTTVGIGDKKKSFKTVVKMRKDSIIWLSISPALGIEAVRIIITPDSIKFIDKINKQYLVSDLKFLAEQRNITADFNELQDIIVTNTLLLDPEERFKSSRDDTSYILTSKTKRKLRKAVGLNRRKEDNIMSQDTVIINIINERKFQKSIAKSDENSLIIKRYWLSPTYWRPTRTVVTDLTNERTIEADYTDFFILENMHKDDFYFPKKVSYTFSGLESSFILNLKYNKVKINKKSSFPFRIPDNYSPLEL